MPYGYMVGANESNKKQPSSGGFSLEDFMSKFSQGGGLFGLGDTAMPRAGEQRIRATWTDCSYLFQEQIQEVTLASGKRDRLSWAAFL